MLAIPPCWPIKFEVEFHGTSRRAADSLRRMPHPSLVRGATIDDRVVRRSAHWTDHERGWSRIAPAVCHGGRTTTVHALGVTALGIEACRIYSLPGLVHAMATIFGLDAYVAIDAC